MLIIPAIDLRDGKCVRLYRGQADRETIFAADPVAVAREWEAKGAPWLHVVDLDGAFSGRPRHQETIGAIVRAVKIPVQLGGGIRTLENVAEALGLGVQRVVLGTVAATDQELAAKACELYGRSIAVGIDVKDGKVAVAGWEATVARGALELVQELRHLGVEYLVYTDTWRDGTLEGVNLEGTREIAVASGMQVIAAGGVASLEDIRALKGLGLPQLAGVILGRALYTGAVKLEEALAVARDGS